MADRSRVWSDSGFRRRRLLDRESFVGMRVVCGLIRSNDRRLRGQDSHSYLQFLTVCSIVMKDFCIASCWNDVLDITFGCTVHMRKSLRRFARHSVENAEMISDFTTTFHLAISYHPTTSHRPLLIIATSQRSYLRSQRLSS